MATKDYREIQVASSLLAVIFLGVLALGVFVFLLGVSVGKKQAEAGRGPLPTVREVASASGGAAKPGNASVEAPRPATETVAGKVPSVQVKETAGPSSAAGALTTPSSATTASSSAARSDPSRSAPASKPTETSAPPETASFAVQGKPDVKTSAAPATAAPAAGLPKAAAPKKGLYYVQVGAYDDSPSAAAVSQSFKSRGYSVVILNPQATDRRPKYRVRVGGYATRDQASAVLARLKLSEGGRVDYWIVKD